MNRDIKFRAWNGEEMIDDFSVQSNGDGVLWSGEIMESWVLMQFTGLKDKNGKEIYEGDVVRRMARRFDFDKPEAEESWEEEEISSIVYRGQGFWVDAEDFGWEGENLWNWESIEVIGNLHEHPHLLTDKIVK